MLYVCSEQNHEIIKTSDTKKNIGVSTVFLGIDHNVSMDTSEPVLFETMVFGGEYNEEQWRYKTWDEAMSGHERICIMVGLEQTKIEMKMSEKQE